MEAFSYCDFRALPEEYSAGCGRFNKLGFFCFIAINIMNLLLIIEAGTKID